jgi:CubicO group peptidase (beta-lactamase class C family)
VANTAAWRGAEIPSTNGHGSARGVARLYAALLQPGRLLSTDLLAEATSAQSTGYCPILHEDVTFGLGFKPTVPRRPFGPNPGSFGHFGTGGAVGFADPAGGVAFGYVMNHVIPRWQSTRNRWSRGHQVPGRVQATDRSPLESGPGVGRPDLWVRGAKATMRRRACSNVPGEPASGWWGPYKGVT